MTIPLDLGPSTPDWNTLSERIRSCVSCAELATTRQHVVVGAVPAGPVKLAFVGEAPGANEDATGQPFIGKAGKLLDELLADAGIDRADVAVLNALKCRPPANRAPKAAELKNCRGWLDQQLAMLAPKLIVSLGGSATGWFFGRGTRLGSVRGEVHDVKGYRVLPTYHPSAAIRFGPRGEPRRLLAADLVTAAGMVAR